MPKIVKKLQRKAARKGAGQRSFSSLPDFLRHYGKTAPDRAAILAPGRTPMTYGALWKQTRDVVRALRRIGVGRTDRVAMVLPHGADAAVAMVAVAAGAVCVPLSPSFTEDEYRRYFGELRLSALLTSADLNSASRRVAQSVGIEVIDVSKRRSKVAGAFGMGKASRGAVDDDFATGADDAFLLLTSGSTSRPKTVPLTHASVCRSADNVGAVLQLKSRDRLLNVLPLYHGHGLISGLITALAAGSSVVCAPGFDATGFFGWLREFRPSWYTAVPAVHRAILSSSNSHKQAARRSSLRIIRSASTTLPQQVLDGLETLFGVPVIDTYGMTESTTQIAANPPHKRKPGSVGRAAGPEIAILDAKGRPLPSGKHGEIALRGPTITRGYDNDPAATASAFRDGWFRTGDLGYLDAEGYLFIVGRIKEIIHKGGQKVAPAEVESALLSHEDVIDVAVFPMPHERLGADVAAAVVLRQDAKIGAQELRDFARGRLAGFKVPGLIEIVSEIPKGPGGKVKRNELAATLAKTSLTLGQRDGKTVAPGSESLIGNVVSKTKPPKPSFRGDAKHRTRNLEIPGLVLAHHPGMTLNFQSGSELKRQLAEIWADILDVDRIDDEQDVFALGVDSLAMTQMVLRAEERFGVDLSFMDLFNAPTVSALALHIETKKSGSAASVPSARDSSTAKARVKEDGPQAVSIVQERMMRIERKLPGLPQFNLPFAYRLQGPLNVAALKKSLADLVRRHASLRTSFAWRNDVPVALVMRDAEVKPRLIVKDLSVSPSAGNAKTKHAKAKKILLLKARLEAQRASLKFIDMKRAPLFRAYLLRLEANDHVLLVVMHDIIIDGWSMAVFMEDLSELYSASIAGKKARLPEPELHFFEFAHWQREWCTGAAANTQFAYWKQHLDKVAPIFSAPKINIGGEITSSVVEEPFQLSKDVAGRLRALNQGRGVTMFMTLLAGFKTLLLLRSGRTDICVATLMANRAQLNRERVIGPFASTALIRTQIDPDLSFSEALNRVRAAVLEAHARQELPFDVIADRLMAETDVSPASLVQAYFVLQVAFRRIFNLGKVAANPFGYTEGRTVMPIDRAWLSLTLSESASGITGICGHKSDLFEQKTARNWIADYMAILAKAVANPNKELGRLVEL